MEMLLRRMKADAITVHGFRSSFRDWCGEETDHPRELAEAALAHTVGDTVERAYRRGDALQKRQDLMNAWADYVEPRIAVAPLHSISKQQTSERCSTSSEGAHVDIPILEFFDLALDFQGRRSLGLQARPRAVQ